MSLISEALKKARQEAARQDAARQGVPYAVGSTETRDARNPLLMALAGLGAGCLLAGSLFVTAFFAGWGPFESSQAAPAPQVAQAPPPPATTAPVLAEPLALPPIQIQAEEPAPVPATPPPAPSRPAPEPQPAPRPIEIRPAVPAPRPEPVPAEPVPAPEEESPIEEAPAPAAAPAPAPEPPPVPAAGGLVEGQTYTGEVPVPGGGTIRLNGIAFSQERPVVVLDGRVMGTGEVVQGFTVVEIEASRVKLQGHGATVYVSPK